MLDIRFPVSTLRNVTRTTTSAMHEAWYASAAVPSRLRPAGQPFAETLKRTGIESGHQANLDTCLA